MRIVLAPDSFKGSLSARELCAAMREGIEAVDASAVVEEIPVADGGEGTVDAMVHAAGGERRRCRTSDPLGRPIEAEYGVIGDGRTAVIEMAAASGLPLLKPEERNPLAATSRGTGELIIHAARAGCRRFIIGLGGSATNDGGAGMLAALGVRLLDAAGAPLPEGGAALERLAAIDLSGIDAAVRQSEFVLAGDVTNPLCGPNGASAVFGPQKGATAEMVQRLDRALERYGQALAEATGRDAARLPGSGAAGGMGAALMAVLGADSRPGIEVVLEAVRFESRLTGADLIITGEGKLDRQTLSGKVIAGVCSRAARHGVPVIALCGGMSLSGAEMDRLGLRAAFSIVPGPCELETAMRQAADWARRQTEQIMRLIGAGG